MPGRRGAVARGRPLPPAAPRPSCCVGGPEGTPPTRSTASAPARRAKHALCGEVDGRATVARGAPGGELLAEALRSVLRARRAPVRVGVGTAVEDLRDAARSHRHALAALQGRPTATSTRWDDLRAERLLTALPRPRCGDLPRRHPATARRRPRAARADARDLPRPRRRRQADRRRAVAAPHEPLLPAAPDRGDRRRGPHPRRGPAPVPRGAAAEAK